MAAMAPSRAALETEAARWFPHYQKMYQKMLTKEVGFTRWVGNLLHT